MTQTFKVVLEVAVNHEHATVYQVLPKVVDCDFVREQMEDCIEIDHPAVGCRIVSVKEKRAQ